MSRQTNQPGLPTSGGPDGDASDNDDEMVVAATETGDGEPAVISAEDVRQGRRGEHLSLMLALSLLGAAGAIALVLFFFMT